MPVLSAEDLAFFEENGYVVAKGAISRDQAAATAAEVWDFTGMDADDPSTWCEWAHCISLPAPPRRRFAVPCWRTHCPPHCGPLATVSYAGCFAEQTATTGATVPIASPR